ncbi:Fungal pheromone mating factor STE2 GPCR [Penicillium taxi]|uniref:Fungal pheromone mating factor STE2 GPCR n=1 Tax=Penicillium taxi TaxID=168475 RepID=UPI0025458071|nr:Fungal pheromone mating factor STE2 GPCR [Penicillium taxi]KAJ5884766.1 Fungal pheromone mating factor STE2 GPCR [Penicillium taxi]
MYSSSESSFDPFTQNVTFQNAQSEPFVVSVDQLDSFVQYNVRICINYGCQLGASIVLFVILLLLTRREKRTSAVFILNVLALLFNIIRLLFQVIHFTTEFENVYPYFSYDYSSVPPSAYGISIAGVIFETFLVICIMISLVLQVHVVCMTLRRRYRHPILALSILMALVPIGVRIGWTVENIIFIVTLDSMRVIWAFESGLNIAITTSVCYFCTVFVTKLGIAIRQRRHLGVHDFGPMKVIFACGCQTLTIPALFCILQYVTTVPELASNVLTLVALSLPLSSIWAGATLENSRSASSARPSSRRNLWQALAFGADRSTLHSKEMSSQITSQSATLRNYSGVHTKSQDSQSPLEISVAHDISINSARRSISSMV